MDHFSGLFRSSSSRLQATWILGEIITGCAGDGTDPKAATVALSLVQTVSKIFVADDIWHLPTQHNEPDQVEGEDTARSPSPQAMLMGRTTAVETYTENTILHCLVIESIGKFAQVGPDTPTLSPSRPLPSPSLPPTHHHHAVPAHAPSRSSRQSGHPCFRKRCPVGPADWGG